MVTTLAARRLINAQGHIDYPLIAIKDGHIAGIEAGEPNGSTETLTACFFDIHVHGACSYDVMTATKQEIGTVGRFLAAHGVSHYLPTTVTAPLDVTLRALETLADVVEAAAQGSDAGIAAVPAGIHLEGPFLSHIKRGVHPEASLLEPSIDLFDQFQQAARGHIRLMTIAPELTNACDLIQHAAASGVRISMGHSNAKSDEALAAIAAGASSATHLFNAMRAFDHREPGIVGAILDRNDVYAEAICDGIHVDPAVIRLWLKIKGEERAILVTDGMSATGMPDGTYMLGTFEVVVKNGVCLSGTTLAGSVLTMEKAVANVQRFTGASIDMAVRLASRNPARMLGLDDLVATRAGLPANFNVYGQDGHRSGTILHGKRLPA